jgi:ribonuclease BN (tRNA processing enzyme)
VGPTALAAVERFGVDTSPLERLFVTHLHGDHVAGWPFLLLRLAFVDRRERPLEVVGPAGVRECLDGLMRHCYDDLAGELGFEVRYRELPVCRSEGLVAGGTAFDVWPMEHHPTSLGYRIETGGRSVGVSGDTAWCPNLERLGQASDVVLVECTSVEPRDFPHVALEEIRERHDRLGGGEVVLVHLTDEVAADLAARPIPRTLAGYDGMALAL